MRRIFSLFAVMVMAAMLVAAAPPAQGVPGPVPAGANGELDTVRITDGSGPVRLAGGDRVATAVAVARKGWTRSDAVVVARADDPADALAGSGLAGRLDAPMLITPSDGLPGVVADEVARLGASVAYVLGGPAAVSDAVVDGLAAAGVGQVERVAGSTRYDTAARISGLLDVQPGATVFLVGNWPDALGVSAIAARQARQGAAWPVLVTGATLPDETRAALRELAPARVVIAGGPAAVSAEVEAAVRGMGLEVSRKWGPDRYATGGVLAAMKPGKGPLIAATGGAFPDGLAAGPLAARLDGTLLLVPPSAARVLELVTGKGLPDELVLLGGELAIPEQVADPLWSALRGELNDGAATTKPARDPSYAVDVRVAAGQNIQKVVDSYPAGSTFLLGAGVHRLQSVVARRGDTFVGEDGAVLSGARVLSAGAVSWQSSGGDWFVGGQTQQGFVHGDIDAGGNALHARPEELFVGGVRWEPVGSRAQLGDGRWFFDYANDRIWLGVDPAGLGLIETSAAVGAFGGDQVKDVTIANLTIEKYATPGQHGAIGFFGEHWTHDWKVRDVVVRDNHGAGIRIGPGMTIDGCRVSNNGQIGIAGSGTDKETGYATPIVVRNCEIDHNLQLDYRFSWEGGATKFKYTVGSLIENNWVHDNHGLGLWFDVDNYNAVIRSNLVENNDVRGIMYEISYGNTEIYWNTVRNNGHAAPSEHQAMGILVSNSENVRVYENVVYGSPRGIAIRADANRSPAVRNVVVTNNDVVQGDGWSGMFLTNGMTTNVYTSYGNKFTGNTWRLDSTSQPRFHWHDSTHTAAQWQDYGQDTNGTFVQSSKPGALPNHATTYNPHTVGP